MNNNIHYLIDCLQRKGYDESKCTYYIDQLYACCATFYRQQRQEQQSSTAAGIKTGSNNNNDDDDPFDINPKSNNDNGNFQLKRTVSCPIPSLLELKIKQRLEDSKVDAKLLKAIEHKKK